MPTLNFEPEVARGEHGMQSENVLICSCFLSYEMTSRTNELTSSAVRQQQQRVQPVRINECLFELSAQDTINPNH